MRHSASALGTVENLFSQLTEQSEIHLIKDYVESEALPKVKDGVKRCAHDLGKDIAGQEWCRTPSSLWTQFACVSTNIPDDEKANAMRLIRDGAKTLFGPGSRPELVEEAFIRTVRAEISEN